MFLWVALDLLHSAALKQNLRIGCGSAGESPDVSQNKKIKKIFTMTQRESRSCVNPLNSAKSERCPLCLNSHCRMISRVCTFEICFAGEDNLCPGFSAKVLRKDSSGSPVADVTGKKKNIWAICMSLFGVWRRHHPEPQWLNWNWAEVISASVLWSLARGFVGPSSKIWDLIIW